jgi:hypothetical protein
MITVKHKKAFKVSVGNPLGFKHYSRQEVPVLKATVQK